MNNQKKNIIKEFNTILECFIGQVCKLTNRTIYHTIFKQLIKLNSTFPINEFSREVLVFENKIITRDESFFLQNPMIDNKIKNENPEIVFKEIFRLKDVWISLDDECKNKLWELIIGLFYLAKKYSQI